MPAGGSVAYTTPALERDVVTFGDASLDLWIASTTAAGDLEATLTEVRPDGQETFVQRGWLRMANRRLDRRASTRTRPVQTHREVDARPLVPGQPTFARLAIQPVSHVFRQGSSIRVTIEAPSSFTGLWGFDYDTTPSTLSVLHDAAHRSKLVLGILPDERALAPLPDCNTVLLQFCRPSPFSVPGGTLTMPSL